MCGIHGITPMLAMSESRRRATRRRRAGLPTSAGDMKVLLDSVPAFIWYKDRDNRILRANRLAAESLGMSVEQVEGLSTYDLYPEEAAQYHLDDLEVIGTGEPKLGIVEVLTTASGEKRWVRTDKIPYRDEDGEIVGVIVFAVDISERMRAEEALQCAHDELERRVDERTQQLAATVEKLRAAMIERQRAEEQVRQQQAELAHVLRLRTVEGMAAQLAHEINQPLAAVVNFARGLARWLSRPEFDVASAQRVTDQISHEALRAAEVVQRLRAFLGKDAPKKELCDPSHVVREAACLIDDEARRAGVALHLDLDPHAAQVEIDVIQIEQVVLNLLRNALEARDERSQGPRSIVVQTVTTPTGGVEVRVRDDGPGLPVDDVQQLFEAFFTTKERSLGMGLSISQKIVEAQGGALWGVANHEGGATFGFTLPPAHPSRSCGSP
jgi:PAS domain S-box-containing protein